MEPMEFDFWQTVAEAAIRGVVAALLVILVALVRLVIKSRTEYKLFITLSGFAEVTGEQVVWYSPALRFEPGTNTTWAYEPTAQEQMKWWTWCRKVLWYSLLYKRSTTEPKGLSGASSSAADPRGARNR